MGAYELQENPILADVPGPWGAALLALRLKHRLSRKAMAKRAGMTPTTYGRLEKGGHTRTERLQAIADAFFLPLEAILQIVTEPASDAPGDTAKLRAEVALLRRELTALWWDERQAEPKPRPKRRPARAPTPQQLEAAKRKAKESNAKVVRLMDQQDEARAQPKKPHVKKDYRHKRKNP